MSASSSGGDLEKRWSRAIDRAGLLNDPYGELLALMPEVLSELRSARTAPLDHRVVRQVARAVMSSEERRRWTIGCAVVAVVGIVLAATAGWSFRDSILMRHCLALYQSDVCLAITR